MAKKRVCKCISMHIGFLPSPLMIFLQRFFNPLPSWLRIAWNEKDFLEMKRIFSKWKGFIYAIFSFYQMKRILFKWKAFSQCIFHKKRGWKGFIFGWKVFSNEKDFNCFQNLQKKWKGKENYFDLPISNTYYVCFISNDWLKTFID